MVGSYQGKEGWMANADHSHPRLGLARQRMGPENGIAWYCMVLQGVAKQRMGPNGKSQTTSIDPTLSHKQPPIHISSHSGEKSNKCNQCDYEAKRSLQIANQNP